MAVLARPIAPSSVRMNSVVAFLTPLALLLPTIPVMAPSLSAAPDESARAAPEGEKSARGFAVEAEEPLRLLEETRRELARQVRIEQRVIVRIAPSSRQRAERSFAELSEDARGFEEVRLGDCVPINMIAAVSPHENRLLLFMRDQRILSASLERTCSAEDFYSGFYIERQDGRLCERRDRLQSRAGASCQVTRLNRLVAARD